MAATVMASMSMMSRGSLTFSATAGTRATAAAAAFFPASALAPSRRALLVAMRAQSEDDDAEPTTAATTTTTTAATATTTTTSSSSPPSPAATPTSSSSKPTKEMAWTALLRDALAFSGPAPERINGRLAMVGFVASLAVEALRGGDGDNDLLSQASCGSGLACFAATAAVLTVASLVPLLNGDSAEDRGGGVMTADAELWNGRCAMLGIFALAFTEYLTGAPFISEIIAGLS